MCGTVCVKLSLEFFSLEAESGYLSLGMLGLHLKLLAINCRLNNAKVS
jgi:hypothetical protein